MIPRLSSPSLPFVVLASLAFLVGTGCTNESGDDEAASGSETQASDESETQPSDESDTAGETEEKPCGVGVDVCCAEAEPCEVDEDCCDPGTYTCYLVGASYQCADLAALCQQCMTGCEGMAPPEVCEMSCAVFCNPMP